MTSIYSTCTSLNSIILFFADIQSTTTSPGGHLYNRYLTPERHAAPSIGPTQGITFVVASAAYSL